MNILWLSGLLITALISFSAGYNFVHNAEHKEITRLQDALENSAALSRVVFQEAEKRVANANKDAHNNDGKLAIQLHIQNDKPCLPPNLRHR